MPFAWAESWQRSWDQLEESLVVDRERRLGVLVDVVEAIGMGAPDDDPLEHPDQLTAHLVELWARSASGPPERVAVMGRADA